jgi:DNA-binding CsgD family transcriptional regulator
MVKSEKERIDILNDLGLFYAPYDDAKALFYLQEARAKSVQEVYEKGSADADFITSRVYYYKDEYAFSRSFLKKAFSAYEKLGDKPGLADYHFASGELEMLFGNFLKAMEHYQKSIEFAKEIHDQKRESINLNCLARIHQEQGNLSLARKYILSSLKIRNEIKDSLGMATCYTTLGLICESEHKLDSALIFTQKGLDIRIGLGDQRRMASSYYKMGRLLNIRGQALEALNYLNKSYDIFQELEDKTGMVINLLEIGRSYQLLNKMRLGNEVISQAKLTAKETGNKNLLKETYKNISDYFFEGQRYREAYQYFQQYHKLEDSLMDWRKSKMIEELELNYQNRLKDVEIEQLTSRNQIQNKNNTILVLSLISVLLLAMVLFYLYRVKAQNLRHNKILLEKEKQLHSKDLFLQEKEQNILKEKIETKNRELGVKVLSMLRTNEMQEMIVNKLGKLTSSLSHDQKALKELNQIIRELENKGAQNLWEDFDSSFTAIHPDFYKKLLAVNPNLTPSEIKIAAFLKMNLTTKEIAALTFKTQSGIKSTRHRLRKKLGLHNDESVVNFLLKL